MQAKLALVNCADTGPLESLWRMLRTCGYVLKPIGKNIKRELRNLGCDNITDIDWLVNDWGYEPSVLGAEEEDDVRLMDKCDLYVDVKAHRNGPKFWDRWPNLRNRTLWYRINGCKPEHVITRDGFDCGDEVNPPCPILTPNLWYRDMTDGRAYSCYPPFYRFDDYYPIHGRTPSSDPICLVHNLQGWGYGALTDNFRKMGVKCYGVGSPDGLVQHKDIPQMLSTSLAMVHLKSSDAPGYALYEALAAACPIICTRRLIWRNRMEDLLIPEKNCLVFDRETHEGLSAQDVNECTKEVRNHLEYLELHPEFAREVGENGRSKLKELMWSPEKAEDVASLKDFMERNFQ